MAGTGRSERFVQYAEPHQKLILLAGRLVYEKELVTTIGTFVDESEIAGGFYIIATVKPEIKVPFGVNYLWDPTASVEIAAAMRTGRCRRRNDRRKSSQVSFRSSTRTMSDALVFIV